jgi:hypothetical protein
METILTQLKQSFADWQASSSRKRQSNASLRTQAVKCLDHYTYREISTAIGVSNNTLRAWQKSFDSDQKIIENSSAFVAMNLDHTQGVDTEHQEPFSLQVSLPDGITIQVNSNSMKSSVAFIIALNKESRSCSI